MSVGYALGFTAKLVKIVFHSFEGLSQPVIYYPENRRIRIFKEHRASRGSVPLLWAFIWKRDARGRFD
jgi:hypothetical protein